MGNGYASIYWMTILQNQKFDYSFVYVHNN